MIKRYIFWIKSAIFFQLLTATMHSISFFNKPVGDNEIEKQMIDIMTTHKLNVGAGFTPTFYNIFTGVSVGFSLLFILGGLINIYLIKMKVSDSVWNGIININLFIYGICFASNLFLTFLPPIICTGLIFLSLLIARITFKKAI